jgi:DNA-binding NtrC family response regulator
LAERVTKIEAQSEPGPLNSFEPPKQPHPAEKGWMPTISPQSRKVFDQLDKAAHSDAPILLLGDSGVGKEMAACYVHRRSHRQHANMVTIDCTTLTESLFEAELFGHEVGAYTGANRQMQGLVEQAQGGTLFLDEIGELSLPMQAKLLRLLEQRRIRRVGGRRDIDVDFRVIAATNRDLEASINQGRFRTDLYYRLACISLTLPCLRERTEDILPLAAYFISQINKKTGRQCCLSESALEKLQHHDFPGNIRELKNRVQRAITLAETAQLEPNDLGFDAPHQPKSTTDTPKILALDQGTHTPISLAEQEKMSIQYLLRRFDGHRRKVADALGISERTLYRKLKNMNAL